MRNCTILQAVDQQTTCPEPHSLLTCSMFTRIERPTFSHFRRSQPWTTQITVNILILILLVVVLVIINITSHNTRPSSTRMGGLSDWTKQNNTEYQTSTVYSDKEYFLNRSLPLNIVDQLYLNKVSTITFLLKVIPFAGIKVRAGNQHKIEQKIELIKSSNI